MIGWFIQEDTYYGDGLNLYEYCRNNTITYKDPTGHNICATQRDLYHKYKEEGMSPQEAYQKMRKELGLDSKSGYKDSGVGNGKDPWRSYESGSNTVNPKDVNFMQSSIKNQTGEHTVLGNAEALKNGTLQATDLPEIRIWKDVDGKLWTLDHRRLAAFRIAELDSVPFRWATDEEIAGQMWKMTTKTNGTSIKLKLGNGESITIQ